MIDISVIKVNNMTCIALGYVFWKHIYGIFIEKRLMMATSFRIL